MVAARILANGACDKKPVMLRHGKIESQRPRWKEDPWDEQKAPMLPKVLP